MSARNVRTSTRTRPWAARLWAGAMVLFLSLAVAAPAEATPIYTFGNSNAIPKNTISASQFTLTTPSDFTIAAVTFTATIHPGVPSVGPDVPVEAGYIWITLERSSPTDPANNQTITLFNFPATYPPQAPPDSTFDHADILTELNGAYVFDDSAATDFDTATIAAIGGSLAPGTYHSSIDSLDGLVGTRGNDVTYRVRAASLWSGTWGTMDWELNLTPVPEPGTFLLLATGLASIIGLKRKLKK